MYGLLQSFAKWLEGTPWGVGVRTSLWAYPFTELIHFTRLSIWLGTNLALDLRLLGLGKRRETAAPLREDLFAWNWIRFFIVVTRGFFFFFPSPAPCFFTTPFFLQQGVFFFVSFLSPT